MIFFLNFYLYLIEGAITFDTNLNTIWNYQTTTGFRCQSSSPTKSQTITFSSQFAHIPQVFLVMEKIDLDIINFAGYNISITSITVSNFIATLECNGATIYRLNFQWYAYDDQRIQVINSFASQPKTTKFSHSNPNINKYFISLIGMSVQGLFDFQLKVDSLTPTDVTVSITDPTGKLANLKQISYQIILGTDDAFTSSALIYSSSTYSSATLSLVSTKKLALPYVGFTFSCLTGCTSCIQNQKVYTTTSTTVSYTISKWDAGVLYTSNYHQQIWLLLSFTQSFQSITCVKARSASYMNIYNLPATQFELTILDSVYSSQGIYSQLISNTVIAIPIIVRHSCTFKSTILSKLLKCQNCSSNNYQFTNYCHSQVNTIYVESHFIPKTVGYQEIWITISNNNCKIIQIIYNQIIEQITIVEIQVT